MDLKPPANLDVNDIVESWKKFKVHYGIYSTAKKLHSRPEKDQAAKLLKLLGKEAVDLVSSLSSDRNDLKNPETIISILDNHVNSKYNLVYRRYLFNNRSQSENENFEKFYDELKELAEDCEFKDDRDSLIRDRIILGIRNDSLRKRLLIEECSLVEVVRICNECEKETRETERKIDEKDDADLKKPPENSEAKRCKENHGDKHSDYRAQSGHVLKKCAHFISKQYKKHKDASQKSGNTDHSADNAEKSISFIEAEMKYDPVTFWKNLPTMRVKKAEPEVVNRMTKKLFNLILTKRLSSEILSQAGDVASQLRSPDDVHKLIIDPEDIEKNTQTCACTLGVMEETRHYRITCPITALFYKECFTNVTEKYAFIWGPVFAFQLLKYTSSEKYYSNMTFKNLRKDLANFYYSADYKIDFCPQFENEKLLQSHLYSFWVDKLSVQYNTIMYGLISAYCKDDASPRLLSLLNFLAIPSLKYKGLRFYVLIDELTKYFKCSAWELATQYCYPECTLSWAKFFSFEEKCLEALSNDKLWCYARNFRGTAFSKLSYINNYFLCNLLWLQSDIIFKRTYSDYERAYKSIFPVSIRLIVDAKLAHSKLKLVSPFKMGSKEAEKRVVEAEKMLLDARSITYMNLRNREKDVPFLTPTEVNYVILTHIELEKKFRSGSLTPLTRKLIPEVEQAAEATHREYTVEQVLDFLRRVW